MNAPRCRLSSVMRVLSPRMLPPVTVELGSTASTATRLPALHRRSPSVSISVLLPTPGAPVMPMRSEPPVCGSNVCNSSSAAVTSAALWLSTSVMPRARAAVSPPRIAAARPGMAFTRDTLRARSRSFEQVEQLDRRLRNHGAGPEHFRSASRAQRGPVLRGNHAADHDEDVAAPLLPEQRDQLGHEGLVRSSQRADAAQVHVVLDRLPGHFVGRLEQRSDVDIEAHVRERARDHARAAVVTVLTHLRDQKARAAAVT